MKTKKILLLLLAVIVVGGAGYYVYHRHVIHNFTAVTEGKVYRSGVIPPDELPDFLEKYNIKSVVDLRRPGTEDHVNNPEIPSELKAEQDAVSQVAGVKYYNVGSTQLPAPEVLDKFYEVMDNPDNYPVLIHCYHGEGRAPLFGAIYQIEYEGMDKNDARKETGILHDVNVFGKNKSKGKYLLEYKTREEKKQ